MDSLMCLLLLVETLLQSLSVGGLAAAHGVIYAAAPEERGAFHVGGKGVYNYGYNTGDGTAKVEVRHLDGSVTGSYRYFDPLGRQIVRSYIADKRGFRVLGNELPVAPNTPAIGIVSAHTLTGPVEGTQEFSSPNIVTPDDKNLIFQDRFGGRYTAIKSTNKENKGISQLQQKLSHKQNEVMRQHGEMIIQQEEKLAKLKAQYERLIRQQERQLAELKSFQIQSQPQQTIHQSQSGYWMNKAFGFDSPYFYSNDKINYDFPAGFAYNVAPSNLALNERDPGLFVAVGQPQKLKSFPKTQHYRHPFVGGHSR